MISPSIERSKGAAVWFTKVKMVVGGALMMLLVGLLTILFTVFIFFRKIITGGFTSAASEKETDLIGSAQAQMNAIQANLEKKEKPANKTIKSNLSSFLWSRVFKTK